MHVSTPHLWGEKRDLRSLVVFPQVCLLFNGKRKESALSAYLLAKLLFTFSKSSMWGLNLGAVLPHVFNASTREAGLGRSL